MDNLVVGTEPLLPSNERVQRNLVSSRVVCSQGGRLRLEQAAGMAWNQRPASPGIGGRLAMESVAGMAWNTQMWNMGSLWRVITRSIGLGTTLFARARARGRKQNSRNLSRYYSMLNFAVLGVLNYYLREIIEKIYILLFFLYTQTQELAISTPSTPVLE